MWSVSMSSGGGQEGGWRGGLKLPGGKLGGSQRSLWARPRRDNRLGRGFGGGQAEESSGTTSGMQVQAGVLWGVM